MFQGLRDRGDTSGMWGLRLGGYFKGMVGVQPGF